MNRLALAGSLMALQMLVGCATNGSVDAVRRDVDETKTRIYSLEKELTAAREGEKDLEDEFAALRKTDADLQASLDSTRTDMQALSGKVDDAGVTMKRSAEELARYREDADRRIVALEDRVVKLQAALDELNRRLHEGSTLPVDTAPAEILYQKGLESFKAGDMSAARTQLTAFLDQQPQHELVSNARYWIGETFYSQKNYEQAILEFQEVIKQFPKKEKAPSAMLKQALSFKALKDVKSSRYVLGKLVQEYPKSDEAKKARVLLKELK
ncbi:MAG: tol-pal system protein YbgF [Trichlorobacter sp.]|jgi:tol-pal system protein YbgF